jgi:hypothetical protein
MVLLQIDTFTPTEATPAVFDIGPDGDGGVLTQNGGNLYLYADGHEIGSLWFHRDVDGVLRVTLGSLNLEASEWEPAGSSEYDGTDATLEVPELNGDGDGADAARE